MSHKRRIQAALKLDDYFQKQSLLANDINIYPYLRLSFFIHLIRKDYVYKHSFNKRLLEFFKSFIKFYLGHFRFNNKIIDNNSENLFLSYSTFRRNKINGKWLDIYVDSYIMVNAISQKSSIIEVPQRGIFKTPKWHNSFYLNPLLQFKARLYASRNPVEINSSNLQAAISYMKRYEYALDKEKLQKKVAELYFYKEYFRKELVNSKVKNVFVTSFSMNFSMGLIWAANELGLNSYELQHGSVYEDSPYYCHWSGNDSPILPKKFLVWTSEQEKFINETCNNFPVGINNGNNYLKLFKNKLIAFDAYDKVWNKYITNQNSIIIALQREDLPEWVVEPLINLTKGGFYIVLRAHPGLNNRDYIKSQPNIKKLLLSERVFLQELEEVPLFYILNEVRFLIAGKSTTIIEAALFDKKSIIIAEDGIEYFNQEIENNMVLMGYNCDKFQVALKNIL